jgi:tetratricopeptide (TPR) repeat protein
MTVLTYQRVRRKQLLREAEGYLDLATVLADRWPLPAGLRDGLAQRALDTLSGLQSANGCKGMVAYLRGQALRIMERYPDAITALERAAELDPSNIHIWLALGWCYKRTGRLDMAIQSLEEALSIDANQAIVYYNLACYWSLAQSPQHALDYLDRAFQMDSAYRSLATTEPDFDPIRDHPRFQELTGAAV